MRRNTLFECTDVLKINSKKKFKKILKKYLNIVENNIIM